MFLDFEEISVVDDGGDHVLDVIGHAAVGGNQRVELFFHPIHRIVACAPRRVLEIVRRHKAEQFAHHAQTLGVIVCHEVRYARFLIVCRRTAEFCLRDLLVRDGLDHVRTGNEHVGGLIDHQDEVGDCRRIHGTPCTGAHDGGDLRHYAAGQRVAQKNVGIASERHHALLDARASAVVQADDRRANAHRHVHDLDDLRCVRFGQ